MAEWLGMAQLAALIIAGGWAAFLFFRFDARDKDLTRQRAEIELRRLKSSPLSFNQDIAISQSVGRTKSQVGQYFVDYSYAITNSTSQKLTVGVVAVHALSLGSLEIGPLGILEIPPLVIGAESKWKRVLSKAYVAENEEVDGGVYKTRGVEVPVTPGGGFGTGDLESGETSWGSLSLLVRRGQADYIGFYLEAFVRFEDQSKRWVTSTQFARLVSGKHGGSPNAKTDVTKRAGAK